MLGVVRAVVEVTGVGGLLLEATFVSVPWRCLIASLHIKIRNSSSYFGSIYNLIHVGYSIVYVEV